MIDIKNLSVTYKNNNHAFTALKNLNLYVSRGDICAVIGPSGCGKTTMLHVLSGILRDFSGSVLIGGESVDPNFQRIGLVLQNYGLLDWRNVYENSVIGSRVKDGTIDTAYTDYILNSLGLGELNHKFPNQLSGGQKQRIAIARSFILKPDILLMDEPFSALDALTREEVQDLFLKVWKENRVATIFITHSIEEAVYVGNKIAILSNSPGTIVEVMDNPLFGTENLRLLDEYYSFSLKIRKKLKEGWST